MIWDVSSFQQELSKTQKIAMSIKRPTNNLLNNVQVENDAKKTSKEATAQLNRSYGAISSKLEAKFKQVNQ